MGWPKGKPRKPKMAAALAEVPLPQLTQVLEKARQETSYEPVSVKATLLSGKEVAFKASTFDVVSGRYTFISFPPNEPRGFKTVRMLRWDQLAMIEITAPEPMCDQLKEWVPPPVVAGQVAVTQPQGPVHYGNAHAEAIRNANLAGTPPPPYPQGDKRAPTAINIPNAPGIPMSKISANDDGKPEIVGASLMG